ncbi:hypothetical protein JOC86_003367 [Bacillus pakistanensis]|uniref:Uncharacterized protein n=1 Tax=Rossellomorea pakistanensis TaxID=992288 RepID=A0ABS2NG22_9BACI|nr:hypothetical protein [Bacillus pakistanensis]MBM7586815.1 hypothetical protein [Bacillus pakistanensis]
MLQYSIPESKPNGYTYQQEKNYLLKEDQVIYARVNKILPEGFAEVQIGNRRLVAQLEAPLLAGGKYWFRVVFNDKALSLIVLPSPNQQVNVTAQINSILESLKIEPIKEHQLLLSTFLSEKISFSKEMVSLTGGWLSEIENKHAGLQAVLKMLKQNFPMTKNIFDSLVSMKDVKPIVNLIEELSQLLKIESQINGASRRLLTVLESIKKPFETRVFHQVVGEAMSILLDRKQPFSTRYSSFQLLQKVNVLKANVHFSSWETQHFEQYQSFMGEMARVESSYPKGTTPLGDNAIYQNLINNANELTKAEQIKVFNKGLANLCLQDNQSNLLRILGSPVLNSRDLFQPMRQLLLLSTEEPYIQLLRELIVRAEADGNLSSLTIKDAIKEALGKLGLDFEASLHRQESFLNKDLETLKPILLDVLASAKAAREVKELAERLILRMNGQLLLSQENGPLLQIIQSFPFYWLGQQTDVHIQWVGQKNENNELNTDHCRILFYLKLEYINEVIVDMLVQNRVVLLSIVNENPNLKELLAKFIPPLKKGLEKLNYQLSHVQFKIPEINDSLIESFYTHTQDNDLKKGVDMKI